MNSLVKRLLIRGIGVSRISRHVSSDNNHRPGGVNLSDTDEIDNLENNYNNLYLKLHQNNSVQPLKMSGPSVTDIDNVDDIEEYESLYLNSYQQHVIKEEVKKYEESLHEDDIKQSEMINHNNEKKSVVGRIYLGPSLFRAVSSSKILTTAEIAGIMAAKRTVELVPDHLNTLIHKVELTVELDSDQGEVVVTAAVDSDDDSTAEAMIACSTALVTIFDHAVKLNSSEAVWIRDIQLK